jgi:hypothetical protein
MVTTAFASQPETPAFHHRYKYTTNEITPNVELGNVNFNQNNKNTDNDNDNKMDWHDDNQYNNEYDDKEN